MKPNTIEQAKFEYSTLGKIFNKGLSGKKDYLNGQKILKTKITNRATKNKINIQSKNLIYNSRHSFVKYRDIDEFKELSLDSFYKKLNKFNDEITSLKNVSSRKEEKKN